MGEWTGESSVMMGPGGTETSQLTEKASLRAGGTVLLLEGRGTVMEEGEQRVVHDAFGAIT